MEVNKTMKSAIDAPGEVGWLADVVDAVQAAAMLGVSQQHVVLLFTTGRIPGRRLTSTWITSRQAVEAYAQNRRGPGRPRKDQNR